MYEKGYVVWGVEVYLADCPCTIEFCFEATIKYQFIDGVRRARKTRSAPNFIPILGLHTVASNETLHTANGQSALIVAMSCMKWRLECARTTPVKAGVYLE